MLAPRIAGAKFLDLCAGTGAVGIEALSRGAEHVTFVDQSRIMCALVEANAQPLKIVDQEFEVITSEASKFLGRYAKKGLQPFDIIFFDPPYVADYEAVLNYAGDHSAILLNENGLVVVEHQKKREFGEEFGGLGRYRVLKQGDSALSFFSV